MTGALILFFLQIICNRIGKFTACFYSFSNITNLLMVFMLMQNTNSIFSKMKFYYHNFIPGYEGFLCCLGTGLFHLYIFVGYNQENASFIVGIQALFQHSSSYYPLYFYISSLMQFLLFVLIEYCDKISLYCDLGVMDFSC